MSLVTSFLVLLAESLILIGIGRATKQYWLTVVGPLICVVGWLVALNLAIII